jgi:hypothetical protein
MLSRHPHLGDGMKGSRKRRKASRIRRALLYLVLVALAGSIVLEVAARMTSRELRWLDPRYVALSQGFADLDALIADAGWGPGESPRYYDEFLYAAAPYTTKHVNFTEYFSARLTPDSVPLPEADHIVWAFGGSTMENTETTDSLTIANAWARVFNAALGPTHVKNFGTGGFFSSYELIKFQKLLRDVPVHERPTLAIFYDGYNDGILGLQYGAGSIQRDLALKLRALVEHEDLVLWAYSSSRMLERRLRLWDLTGARLIEQMLFPLGEPQPDAENLAATVHVYTSNVTMLRATCEALAIRCFFVLQPLIVTKTPLAAVEQQALDELEAHPRFGREGTRFIRAFYAEAAEALAAESGFIDGSGILNGRTEADFYDLGHVGALTPPILGERIATLILARLAGREDAP